MEQERSEPGKVIVEHFKEYFTQTSIHGLHFIVEDERHWTERIFWVICCILSWFATIKLVLSSIEAYQHNAVTYVVETNYLNWNTTFPAVSVCELENQESIADYSSKIYGEDRDYNIDEVLEEIAFFKGSGYFINEFCFNPGSECPTKNYKEISEGIRSPCEKLLNECFWNSNKPFNCCQYFETKETELGTCYILSMSSVQRHKGSDINLYSNRFHGKASILIKTTALIQVYVHAEHDIPFYNSITSETLKSIPNIHTKHTMSVRDIENEPELRLVEINQRNCRFPEENYLRVSDKYSYSACLVDCRMQNQLKKCNCTSHLMPKADKSLHCNFEGLNCLSKMYNDFVVLKPKWEDKPGLSCDCLPSCEDIEMEIVSQESFRDDDDDTSTIELVIDHLPSEKFKRNVVRKRQDLIVYFGGAIGLFVGASIISLGEIMYYFSFGVFHKYLVDLNRKSRDAKLNETKKIFVRPFHRPTRFSRHWLTNKNSSLFNHNVYS
ncbi:sodium channel protein Nach isoform X2 [Planococcus citri]|uniref:sodium channel protein Nach isoform X2 n=1 Tax=Planococcus citri TaxID=170843 RepID=UPI0031F86350